MYSPDGRWIAYTSDETVSTQVYVRSFAPPAKPGEAAVKSPAAGSKTRVSTAGGIKPRWRRDGKELFYIAPNGMLMAVTVGSGSSFKNETPQPLFQYLGLRKDTANQGLSEAV
jgi:Tol biopolymer transport system component